MILIAICGPSASGKTTLAKRLTETYGDTTAVITTTTRPRRPTETDGDYHFCTQSAFSELLKKGAFVEWVPFNGNLYGITHAALHDALENTPVAVVVCTPHAIEKLQRWCSIEGAGFFSVFVHADREQLVSRLMDREQETGTSQADRVASLEYDEDWLLMHDYDLVLSGRDLSASVYDVGSMVAAA